MNLHSRKWKVMTINQHLQSDQINELISALSKAQAEIESAVYDKKNPHFKNNYSSYDAIREACRLPLAKNNLAITHLLDMQENKRVLITQLSHSSGQWMRSFVTMPQEKETPQAMGSAITYSKRYALSAFLAIGSDEDDDGEKAETPYKEENKPITEAQKNEILSLCNGDLDLVHRILKAYRVSKVQDIKTSDLPTIIKHLKTKKEKEIAHENVGA
jgi:hypothetical protein